MKSMIPSLIIFVASTVGYINPANAVHPCAALQQTYDDRSYRIKGIEDTMALLQARLKRDVLDAKKGLPTMSEVEFIETTSRLISIEQVKRTLKKQNIVTFKKLAQCYAEN